MNRTLHLLHDGDSYEIEINGTSVPVMIWRYRQNRTRAPQFVNYHKCDEILQHKIDDLLIRTYGADHRNETST